MKIGIVHPPMYPSSIDLFNLLGAYCDLSIYQIGSCSVSHQEWTAEKNIRKVKNFHLRIYGQGFYSIKRSLDRKLFFDIKNNKPDVLINTSLWFPSLIISLFKKKLCDKYVIWTNIKKNNMETLSKIRYLWRWLSSSCCDAYITGTKESTGYFEKLRKQQPIYQVHQTMDTKKWINEIRQLPSKEYLREKWSLPKNKIILLGVGNLIERKNWESVFNSMNGLKEDILFLLVGEGNLKKKLIRKVFDLKLQDKVLFFNNKTQHELKEIYKSADIFILPSFEETFGFVIQEAMTAGLPVLCSSFAGAQNLVRESFNGYIVHPGKNYQNELKKIVTEFQEMGKNSLSVINEYGIEEYAVNFISVLKSIMKR